MLLFLLLWDLLWYCYCVIDLCEVADLATQFALHSVDGALKLDQLSVQETGIVLVFGEFQNYITCPWEQQHLSFIKNVNKAKRFQGLEENR